MHIEKWFINRIGKRIYRDKCSCPCHTCIRNWKEGLIVHDEQHADYLFNSQYDDILKKDLNYRDKK